MESGLTLSESLAYGLVSQFETIFKFVALGQIILVLLGLIIERLIINKKINPKFKLVLGPLAVSIIFVVILSIFIIPIVEDMGGAWRHELIAFSVLWASYLVVIYIQIRKLIKSVEFNSKDYIVNYLLSFIPASILILYFLFLPIASNIYFSE